MLFGLRTVTHSARYLFLKGEGIVSIEKVRIPDFPELQVRVATHMVCAIRLVSDLLHVCLLFNEHMRRQDNFSKFTTNRARRDLDVASSYIC